MFAAKMGYMFEQPESSIAGVRTTGNFECDEYKQEVLVLLINVYKFN